MIIDIGPKLGAIARVQGIKQTAIATRCGISRITVNRFFNGHAEVKASDFVNILKVLGIDLEPQIVSKLTTSQ